MQDGIFTSRPKYAIILTVNTLNLRFPLIFVDFRKLSKFDYLPYTVFINICNINGFSRILFFTGRSFVKLYLIS